MKYITILEEFDYVSSHYMFHVFLAYGLITCIELFNPLFNCISCTLIVLLIFGSSVYIYLTSLLVFGWYIGGALGEYITL